MKISLFAVNLYMTDCVETQSMVRTTRRARGGLGCLLGRLHEWRQSMRQHGSSICKSSKLGGVRKISPPKLSTRDTRKESLTAELGKEKELTMHYHDP